MKSALLAALLCVVMPVISSAADVPGIKAPARSAVDPALEAQHTKEDVRRHRIMAAAHEAAAKCQESGRSEEECNAELVRACLGIAYGKYCGMKHPD
jgi:hypothetical protein